MPAPLLVFGWGNASRGDDALGPLFVQRLPLLLNAGQRRRVELLEDYQLQVEHVLDLAGRHRVLFVDASVDANGDATAPFAVAPVVAAQAARAASHALTPAELLRVYRQTTGSDAPPCTLLAIRGECFGLGEPVSDAAASNLDAALHWARGWVGGS
ncbi:MAG: hydrogenase maturation protease [Betaproteobacteria bacterium]|nr:hydrogenase maturation protease [Betaproteobacteria bacterium]